MSACLTCDIDNISKLYKLHIQQLSPLHRHKATLETCFAIIASYIGTENFMDDIIFKTHYVVIDIHTQFLNNDYHYQNLVAYTDTGKQWKQ